MNMCNINLFKCGMLIVIYVYAVDTSRDVPDVLKTCDRDDINLNACLKTNIQSSLKALSNGLPEIGLKPLEPYKQKEFTIQYKKNQIYGKATIDNFLLTGLGKIKVLAVRSNIQDDGLELEVDLTVKKLFIEGFLKGEGRFNAIVLKAGGYFNNTMEDIVFTWDIAGKTETKNNETYLRLYKFKTLPEVGNMIIHIPSVARNAELDRLAYYFVNTYWKEIYFELRPLASASWEQIFHRYSNKLFSKIPYNKLFPSSEEF